MRELAIEKLTQLSKEQVSKVLIFIDGLDAGLSINSTLKVGGQSELKKKVI